jgi:hypothetical protein
VSSNPIRTVGCYSPWSGLSVMIVGYIKSSITDHPTNIVRMDTIMYDLWSDYPWDNHPFSWYS